MPGESHFRSEALRINARFPSTVNASPAKPVLSVSQQGSQAAALGTAVGDVADDRLAVAVGLLATDPDVGRVPNSLSALLGNGLGSCEMGCAADRSAGASG